MPLQATSGAASYDAFGGGVPVAVNYIEDVFSTYLYTGNGTSQTITNGIDLSTKGGLVWIKSRSAATNNNLFNTATGSGKLQHSNTTDPTINDTVSLNAFNTTGFSLGLGNETGNQVNVSAATYASWTFRKQLKFFDIVTYTGNGANNRAISHNLGSTPGFIIVKSTSNDTDWVTYHRSYTFPNWIRLNSTDAESTTYGNAWGAVPTSTTFTTGSGTFGDVNANGRTYIAYLFAHDAGGFGLAGTGNVISCGSFSDDASGNATVDLGFEPQWILQKRIDSAGNWFISDVMRGMTVSAAANLLRPNLSSAESEGGTIRPTATGFTVSGYPGSGSFIYIAIRRGPMKVPSLGTTVFTPVARAGTSTLNTLITAGFPVDLGVFKQTNVQDAHWFWGDRLRGIENSLTTSYDNPLSPAEQSILNSVTGFDSNTGLLVYNASEVNNSGNTYATFLFKRAPSFFDTVCYTGTASNRNITHNLGVAPELMIVKGRSNAQRWAMYSAPLYGATKAIFLNSTENVSTNTVYWNNTAPTSSVFRVGTSNMVNGNDINYIAWLFATCAGVSKVGTYTGTGATLQIDCGFTSGARFVLIKAGGIASYVWNSASGIVSGNDPYLIINTNAIPVNTDYIDTYSPGFELTSDASTTVNINGGQYIFLAIA